MNKTKGVLLVAGAMMIFPSAAWAQQELNPVPTDGATITSNSDNSGGEFFQIDDGGTQVFFADGDVTTSVSNANNVGLQYDSDNSSAGSFVLSNGAGQVLSADNAGTVTVANAMNTNGIANGSSGITNAGAVSGVTTLATSGLATLNSGNVTTTLTVGGATTLNNSLAVDSNGAALGGNTLAVGATQVAAVGTHSVSYGTAITGGALVDGDLGVNGNIYAVNPSGNASVSVGNNGLAVSGTANRTAMVGDSNANAADGRGVVVVEEDEAGVLVYNQTTGNPHGLHIDQNRTVLSGGTSSTTLTLSDNGAAFRNTDTGGPARVTGIANGRQKYDAVNYGQLEGAYGGIASVAAMANIPAPPPGKTFAVGIGFGNFEGENAFAFGGTARLHDNVSVQASIGHSDDTNTFGAGVGFSW